MATIQSYYFTKGGTAEWGNCNALSTDKVGLEAIVTFSGAEIGKRYWVNWKITGPSGQDTAPYSDYAYVTATTTFVSPALFNVIKDGIGKYTLFGLVITQG